MRLNALARVLDDAGVDVVSGHRIAVARQGQEEAPRAAARFEDVADLEGDVLAEYPAEEPDLRVEIP